MRHVFAVAVRCLAAWWATTPVTAWGVVVVRGRAPPALHLHDDHRYSGGSPTRWSQRGFPPRRQRTSGARSPSALSSTAASSSPSLETVTLADPLSPPPLSSPSSNSTSMTPLPPTAAAAAATTPSTVVDVVVPNAKECVKLFGRLADKYLLLDASAGLCCYSGCSDCEYRLPGGGYKMADQRSARPKWIPVYAQRTGASPTNVHTSKWATALFGGEVNANENNKSSKKQGLTREEFGRILQALPYETPMGGPSVSNADAIDVSEHAVEKLWSVLSRGKDRLTEKRMAKAWQHLAFGGSAEGTVAGEGGGGTTDAGTSGVTWKQFVAALQSSDV